MDLTNLLNTIRDNASDTYQERIPEATRDNIESIQEVMADPNNAVVVNEFMRTLLNMVIKVVIHNKLFSDPLKSLKRGKKPLGDTVEEVYANFIKCKQYDPTGAELLARELPDVKAIYHRMNRQDKYKVTVSPEQLTKAFSSYEKLSAFIQSIINSLYNSSEFDEFVLMKQLIKQALDNNAIKVMNIDDPTLGETQAKSFIKAVKTVSGQMVYPSTEYNSYLNVQDTDPNAIYTFSKKSEQVLILDVATDVSVNVDVLATVFNMSVAEFNETRKIVIDAFPDPSIRAALVDEQFFQVWDDLVTFREFYNGEGLYTNYYLHVWQTLAYSVLVNAVVFKVASDSDHDGTVEEFTVTNTLRTGVSNNNKNTKVTEGSSYLATLKGIKSTDKVIVTMGDSDITATAYSNKNVEIDTVTGNIVITVRTKNEYTVTNTLASGVTNSNTATKVTEDDSYEGTLSGVTTETVAITMGGTAITTTAYDSETGKISIAKVTGNLVITVS